MASTAAPASRLDMPARSATASTKSCLVTVLLLTSDSGSRNRRSLTPLRIWLNHAAFRGFFASPAARSRERAAGAAHRGGRARPSRPPPGRRHRPHCRTTRPSSRTADTASASAPPEVTTSSRRHTSSPGSKGPSIRLAVPYSLVSPRTMMNGRPDAIAAEAANATAPSAGPASRTASGSHSRAASASASPSALQDLGLGLEAVLVEVPRRAAARAQDEVAFEQRPLDEQRAELVVRHCRSAVRAIDGEPLESRASRARAPRRTRPRTRCLRAPASRTTRRTSARPRSRGRRGRRGGSASSLGSSFGFRARRFFGSGALIACAHVRRS